MIISGIGLISFLACVDKEDDNTNVYSGDTGFSSIDDIVVEDGMGCDNNLCVLSGTITEDLKMTSENIYLLRGGVFIGDDVNSYTLTIDPGTTIYGETSTDGMLAIRRNSQILAEGTADAPIVFTSSKEAGSRARGDWGGLIINGNATINACGDGGTDFCEAFGEGGTGYYGGTDDADNSGVLKYVRVEFAGTLISPENELNGIAFQGVGSGTEVDYVQVHMNADDGVEFFGGTVSAKHLLVTGAGDDSIDWTDGWRGNLQHVIVQQYDDNGDNGIEADNNGDANDAEPRSNPTLANMSIIGSPESADSDLGILLREGTAAYVLNTVVAGFEDAGLDIDNAATWTQATDGNIVFDSVHLNNAENFEEDDDNSEGNLVQDVLNVTGNNTLDEVVLNDPYNQTTPNFGLSTAGSAVAVDPSTFDAWFDAVDYVGAIGSTDWTTDWTTSESN